MRGSVVRRVGPQLDLRHTPDMELWLRLAAFSDVAYIHGADQAWHREHAASMSATEVDTLLDLTERAETFDRLFDGAARTLREAQKLRREAHRAIGLEALQSACHEYDRGRGAGPKCAAFIDLAERLLPGSASGGPWSVARRSAP